MAKKSASQTDMVQGTLDMLILRTLILGPVHDSGIATAIELGSDDVLQVEHGSLYPALHRLETRGYIASFWGTSKITGRRAITGSRPPAANSSAMQSNSVGLAGSRHYAHHGHRQRVSLNERVAPLLPTQVLGCRNGGAN